MEGAVTACLSAMGTSTWKTVFALLRNYNVVD